MKQEISGRESYRSFSEPLLQIKSDTRITDASAAACELLGISREELVGKYLSDFLLDKSVSNKFQKPSAKLHSDVLTLCNRDGAQLRMHTMLFQLENGEILLIFCRHQEELEETRKREAFFRTLVENSDDALAVIDQQGRVV